MLAFSMQNSLFWNTGSYLPLQPETNWMSILIMIFIEKSFISMMQVLITITKIFWPLNIKAKTFNYEMTYVVNLNFITYKVTLYFI